jgi:outer membrane protein OmpA-like peptidoglycan-associated protein
MFDLWLAALLTNGGLAEPRRLDCPEQILEEWPEPKEIPPLVAVRDLIYFPTGRPTLSEVARSTLRGVARCYRTIGDTHVYVVGHTDSRGTTESNSALSRRYAEVVRDQLVGHGVPASVISVTGFGEGRLQVDTEDGVREPRNRRVEILFDARPRQ